MWWVSIPLSVCVSFIKSLNLLNQQFCKNVKYFVFQIHIEVKLRNNFQPGNSLQGHPETWQPSPRSSRDLATVSKVIERLCWLVCDHICSDLPTSASSSLLTRRDILRRVHCWRFWMVYTQLPTTMRSQCWSVSTCPQRSTQSTTRFCWSACRLSSECKECRWPGCGLTSMAGLSMWQCVSTSQLPPSSTSVSVSGQY